jgi:tetratricopeptide (TPR) repeat protein
MSLHILIGLIGLIYIVVFGAMTLLRREGLSIRFAVESVCITAIAYLLVVVTAVQIHPVVFLFVLYIITMRVRIVVDVANTFAGRGNYVQAEKIYNFASRMWPDQTGKLIIDVNHAILLLQKNQLDDSVALFTSVLSEANKGFLGVKYEAAVHYNLGVAYLRKNNPSMATVEFNAVLDTWPASLYARRAQQALERERNKISSKEDKQAPQ